MRSIVFILLFSVCNTVFAQTADHTPLYVIDGKIDKGGLSSINPQEIGFIDIAKDANAVAAYGPAGANGVVFVKTKAYMHKSFVSKIGAFCRSYGKYMKENAQEKLTYYLNDSLMADGDKAISAVLYDLPKSSIKKVKFKKPRANQAGTVKITTKP